MLLIAGIIWFAAGINILRIGTLAIVTCWGKITLWLDIMLPVFTVMILIGFLFMFYPILGSLRYRKFEPTNVICLDDVDFKKIILDLKTKINSPFLQLERNDIMVTISMLAGLRRGELVALRCN